MIRTSALLIILGLQAQEPVTAESKFRALLEKTEKAGLSVPELPEGATELERSWSRHLPRDIRDRYSVVRAQAAVLASLHAYFVKNKGATIDMPVAAAKPAPVKILEVLKRAVKISKAEVAQEIAYSDLDPEWVLATARPAFASEGDSGLWCGLWLAKTARWDAAFLALSGVDSDHPLVLEARKRGLEVAVAEFDAILKGKKWAEALAKLDGLDKIAPGDDRLTAAREKLLDAMVEQGKEHCRKKSKGPMQEIIDLITKHFPDGSSRIDDIREANRWVKVTEPKKFGIAAVKGPPWLLEPKGETPATAWLTEAERIDGVAVVIRFPKGEKGHAGIVWNESRNIVGMSGDDLSVCVWQGNKGEQLPNVFTKKVPEGRHHISVRVRGGEFVIQYNGSEIYRTEGKSSGFEKLALNANLGKAWFDEVWFLKKE